MVCQAAHHRQVQGTPWWGLSTASAHRIRWERSLSSPQCPKSPWKAFGAPLAWQNGPETRHLHNHLVLLPHSPPWDLPPPCKINQRFTARLAIAPYIGHQLLQKHHVSWAANIRSLAFYKWVSQLHFLLSGKDSGILLWLLPVVKATIVSFASLNSLVSNRRVHKGAPFPSVQRALFSHFFSRVMAELGIFGTTPQPKLHGHMFKSNGGGRKGRWRLTDTHTLWG